MEEGDVGEACLTLCLFFTMQLTLCPKSVLGTLVKIGNLRRPYLSSCYLPSPVILVYIVREQITEIKLRIALLMMDE